MLLRIAFWNYEQRITHESVDIIGLKHVNNIYSQVMNIPKGFVNLYMGQLFAHLPSPYEPR